MPEQQNPAKDSQKKRNPERRRQIWSFMGIVFSFMLLLSLVSYTPADQANGQVRVLDLWKVVTPDEALQAKADRTQNLLGLLGAIISNWFINSTIGTRPLKDVTSKALRLVSPKMHAMSA